MARGLRGELPERHAMEAADDNDPRAIIGGQPNPRFFWSQSFKLGRWKKHLAQFGGIARITAILSEREQQTHYNTTAYRLSVFSLTQPVGGDSFNGEQTMTQFDTVDLADLEAEALANEMDLWDAEYEAEYETGEPAREEEFLDYRDFLHDGWNEEYDGFGELRADYERDQQRQQRRAEQTAEGRLAWLCDHHYPDVELLKRWFNEVGRESWLEEVLGASRDCLLVTDNVDALEIVNDLPGGSPQVQQYDALREHLYQAHDLFRSAWEHRDADIDDYRLIQLVADALLHLMDHHIPDGVGRTNVLTWLRYEADRLLAMADSRDSGVDWKREGF